MEVRKSWRYDIYRNSHGFQLMDSFASHRSHVFAFKYQTSNFVELCWNLFPKTCEALSVPAYSTWKISAAAFTKSLQKLEIAEAASKSRSSLLIRFQHNLLKAEEHRWVSHREQARLANEPFEPLETFQTSLSCSPCSQSRGATVQFKTHDSFSKAKAYNQSHREKLLHRNTG